jgi:hypothetical protein
VIEFDKFENFLDARLDLFFREAVFGQAKSDILADGERIEEGAFLKNKSDAAAKIVKIPFGGVRDTKAKNVNFTAIRTHETDSEFKSESLASAGFAKEDEGFAVLSGERDAAEDVALGKAKMNVVKVDDVLTGSERGRSGG